MAVGGVGRGRATEEEKLNGAADCRYDTDGGGELLESTEGARAEEETAVEEAPEELPTQNWACGPWG